MTVLGCMSAATPPSVPAVLRRCQSCPTEVWVSLEMVEEVDTGRVRPMCLLCTRVWAATNPDWEVGTHPAQTGSLAELGILGMVDQFTTEMNRKRRMP